MKIFLAVRNLILAAGVVFAVAPGPAVFAAAATAPAAVCPRGVYCLPCPRGAYCPPRCPPRYRFCLRPCPPGTIRRGDYCIRRFPPPPPPCRPRPGFRCPLPVARQ